MHRLKFCIYGNCQASPLSKILLSSHEFSRKYELIPTEEVNKTNQDGEERLHEIVKKIDLLIYQPVSATYKDKERKLGTDFLLSLLKDNAETISFPVAYFSGYCPQAIYFRDSSNIAATDGFCPYHDLNVLRAYYNGLTWQECVSSIEGSNTYPYKALEENIEDNIDRLRVREQKTEVTISKFIKKHWREEQLFFSFNHCSNSILIYEANQILNLLGFNRFKVPLPLKIPQYLGNNKLLSRLLGLNKLNVPLMVKIPQYLGKYKLLIYPEVRSHFSFNFNSDGITINNKDVSLEYVIKEYYDYYSRHTELIEHNIKLHEGHIISYHPARKRIS